VIIVVVTYETDAVKIAVSALEIEGINIAPCA